MGQSSKKNENLSPQISNKHRTRTNSKHGRRLSTMIYRNVHLKNNKSRISFIVPDTFSSLLSSPTHSIDTSLDNTETDNIALPNFTTLIKTYSSEMMDVEENQSFDDDQKKQT